MTDRRFDGLVAVVTGAGGDIGEATASRLATEGASVALLELRRESLDRASRAVEEAGATPLAIEVDQVDRDAVEAAVGAVVDAFGGVDVLFANVGYGQFASFLDTTPKNWSRHIDVNLTGTFNVCQAFARRMVEQRRGGSIVINASSAATTQCDQLTSYGASKAGSRMLAMGMASELGTSRIRVNAILPGVIETGMTLGMLGDDRHRDLLASETPVGRLGKPSDVAALVAFLLSHEAEFITGASIPIDGGQTLHGHPRWFRQDYRVEHQQSWTVPT